MKNASNTPRLVSSPAQRLGPEPPLSRGELDRHPCCFSGERSLSKLLTQIFKSGVNAIRGFDLLRGVIAIVWAAAVIGCAKDVAPQGGPADLTPPEILESVPVSGAINVGVSDAIEVEFTERINAKTVGNALFISPPLREEPRLRVKGSRLRIIPSVPLDSGKTYVVTLGASVADLNGNKLKNSLTLAFSTGDQIDSGSIHGRIFDKLKPAANFRIFAYAQKPWLTDSLFAIVPDYITESGVDGEFTFQFVKEGEYLVIGVEDKDRDNRISSFSERVGIPVVPATALPAEVKFDAMAMHISRFDSTMISLVTCNGYAGRVVMHFSGGKLDTASVSRDSILVTTTEGVTYLPDGAAVFEKESEKLFIWSEHFLNDSIVTVSTFGLRGQDEKRVDTASTTCIIRIRGVDSEPPELVVRTGANVVYPGDSLRLVFSEPVVIPDIALAIRIDSARTIGAHVAATTPNRFAVVASDSLPLEVRLKLLINGTLIRDLHGNAAKDTLYQIDFSIASPDSMGSLSGAVNLAREREVTLRFTGMTRKLVYTHSQSADGPFSLAMYPDLYTVMAFADRNHNGRWDHGSPMPFRYAEPGWIVPDTLRVRARFDTEGFDLELK